ncbi:retropepsin-like aspartic protease [Chitinophaga sp. RAB17]|uniref:retropepsin-like aspartic protease n=1 Tax=Chitinophaga sp. RAB17 TaxID=3233049 RepID=UPI003F8E7FEB
MIKRLLAICFILISTIVHGQMRLSTPVSIPFTLTSQGHILIKASINGVTGNFIFDTGAGLNMLTKKFADKVSGLKKTDGFYTGHRATGEPITTDVWRADSIGIGSLSFTNEVISIIDIDFPFDGLISLMPFKSNPVTIDYPHKLLIIESAASIKQLLKEGKSIPLQISDERGITLGISTYIRLADALTLQITLDSGAGADVFRFNSRYMDKLGIDSAKTIHKYIKSEFNPSAGNNYYVANLPVISAYQGIAEKKDFSATFIEGLIYEGITSINWLGNKITIDVPAKRLIVAK